MPLKVSTISKRFSNKWALKDVTFEVEDGEVFGVCGPAGSGKSALLEIIEGRSIPNGGTCVFETDDHAAPAPPETLFLASEELRQPGIFSRIFGGSPRSSKSATEAVEMVAKAVVAPAKLIIFDGLFDRLGPNQAGDQIRGLRSAVADGGKICVIASNRFSLLSEACDRIAVLSYGEVLQTDSPQELYNSPVDAKVAAITGRINLIEARRLSSSKEDHPEYQTIVGSHRITAERTEGRRLRPLNQNVQLGIRPENISIAFGASFPEDNILKAVLKEIRFCGPETLVECDAGGLRLTVAVRRLVGLEIGNECVLGLPPERIMLL